MYRAFVYGFSLLLTGLVLWPAFREPPQDSFPLSNYPMFSYGRPDPGLTLTHALGVTEEGERVPLPPMVSSANREVLQSMTTIHAAVQGGPTRMRSFCAEVAGRVAESGDGDLAGVVRVELATSRFDCVAYFEGDGEPLDRTVHYHCPVER